MDEEGKDRSCSEKVLTIKVISLIFQIKRLNEWETFGRAIVYEINLIEIEGK